MKALMSPSTAASPRASDTMAVRSGPNVMPCITLQGKRADRGDGWGPGELEATHDKVTAGDECIALLKLLTELFSGN